MPIKLAPQVAPQTVSQLDNALNTSDAALGVAINGVPIYDYSAQSERDLYYYDASRDTAATRYTVTITLAEVRSQKVT